jgi:DNA-binding CsgD family transcriptional regulator
MGFKDWTVHGREAEVSAVLDMLADGTRLVALVGSGGVGKTAVARKVLQSVAQRDKTNTFWFDMEAQADEQEGLAAISDGIREMLRNRPEASIDGPQLLVLDGAPGAPDLGALAEGLLDSYPGLQILTTCRRLIRLPFARTVEILPLPVPEDPAESVDVSGFVQDEAVLAIFADRAATVAPRLSLDRPAVASILAVCRKLGGLPLAVHLAALRSCVLTPEEILHELDDPFRFLTDDYSTDAPARHRSMHACIDSSMLSLSATEKAVLASVAAFPHGCTLDSLRCLQTPEVEGIGSDPALRIASSLAEWQLLQAGPATPSGTRFTTAPLIRAFVSQYMEAPTVMVRQISEALTRRFDSLAWVKGTDWDHAGAWVDDEYSNLKQVISRSIAGNDTALPATIVHGLFRYWRHRGMIEEGLVIAEMVLAAGGASVSDDARVLGVVGGLRAHLSSYTSAYAELARSVELWRKIDDPKNLAGALVTFSAAAQEVDGVAAARSALSEAMSLFEIVGDKWSYARTLGLLGAVMANDPGELEFARKCLEDTSALLLALGDRGAASLPMEHLGRMLIESGDLDQAFPVLEYGLSESRSLRDPLHTSAYLNLLAWGESLMDRPARAAGHYLESLQIAVRLGLKARAVWCLEGLSEVLENLGSPDLAATAEASARILRDDLGLEYWVEFCCPRRPSRPASESVSRAAQLVRAGGAAWPPDLVLNRVTALLADLAETGARAVAANRRERPDGLTPREVEILGLVAGGLTSRDIAERLVISIDTVGRHITNIYRKIGARGRSDATSYAFRMDLVPDVA